MLAEDWLDGMESAILQLGNEIFRLSDQQHVLYNSGNEILKRSLLKLYQDQSSLLIYQKLKASLQDGALSILQEPVQRSSTIWTDIGLRTRFINLWTESYDLSLLRVAAEVVTGCEFSDFSSFTAAGSQSDAPRGKRPLKKLVARFLVSRILRNEDAPRDEKLYFKMHSTEYFAWSWRRTMLRSLMLVYLLDKSKDLGLFSNNLFLSSSRLKSTTAILKQISTLLTTSSGDISRPLAHLGYHARHVQFAINEYQYDIKNLATDLRDGVRLTRLVELLIFPKDSDYTKNDTIAATITQNKAFRNSAEGRKAQVLSQHLKYPCSGRSQKIHNVQIALSALSDSNRFALVAKDLDAADIVDGHREKTIVILWGIVGRRGLDLLVDFSDLNREIRRFEKMRQGAVEKGYDSNRNSDEMLEGFEKQRHRLRAWAKAIAKLHGLEIRNFTSSFADGAIFHKIVDEYIFHIPSIQSSSHEPIEKESQLEKKLRQLGCNSYFATIFGRYEAEHMFDGDFTVAALAFLCSRLLAASRDSRAATLIQRAYRKLILRRSLRQRCVLLRLAHECKTVSVTRSTVIEATIVIQRIWRSYLGRGILSSANITKLQAYIRGNLVRQRLGRNEEDLDIWLP